MARTEVERQHAHTHLHFPAHPVEAGPDPAGPHRQPRLERFERHADPVPEWKQGARDGHRRQHIMMSSQRAGARAWRLIDERGEHDDSAETVNEHGTIVDARFG